MCSFDLETQNFILAVPCEVEINCIIECKNVFLTGDSAGNLGW